MTMQPYWITIRPSSEPTPLNLGVGVTAQSEAEARTIFERTFGAKYEIAAAHPIEDMRKVEQNHVVPNMGNIFLRGIWFPLGYETQSS